VCRVWFMRRPVQGGSWRACSVELQLSDEWHRCGRPRQCLVVAATQRSGVGVRNDGVERIRWRAGPAPRSPRKKSSFWVKNVNIVRAYERIDGNIVPVALATKAQVRFLGEATLRMTYVYSEIDGHRLESSR
jgi:hypothetical protein